MGPTLQPGPDRTAPPRVRPAICAAGVGLGQRDEGSVQLMAARMRVMTAFSSISLSSWKSMARRVLPSRLELNSPAGPSAQWLKPVVVPRRQPGAARLRTSRLVRPRWRKAMRYEAKSVLSQ